MSKAPRIIFVVLLGYVCISVAHVWLNIGFDKLGLTGSDQKKQLFKVGFLPVT